MLKAPVLIDQEEDATLGSQHPHCLYVASTANIRLSEYAIVFPMSLDLKIFQCNVRVCVCYLGLI